MKNNVIKICAIGLPKQNNSLASFLLDYLYKLLKPVRLHNTHTIYKSEVEVHIANFSLHWPHYKTKRLLIRNIHTSLYVLFVKQWNRKDIIIKESYELIRLYTVFPYCNMSQEQLALYHSVC